VRLAAVLIGAVAEGERVSEKGPYVEPRGHSPLMPAIVNPFIATGGHTGNHRGTMFNERMSSLVVGS
jgi:hypothetical protein